MAWWSPKVGALAIVGGLCGFGFVACSATSGGAKEPKTVEGSVTLEGKSVALAYAYARRPPDHADWFEVLLTDRPVEADRLSDFNIARWPTVHQGISFTLDSSNGCVTGYTLFHKGFDAGQGPSIMGGPCVKDFSQAQGRLSGALRDENAKRKWLVQAEFQIPLPAAATSK